MKKLLAILSTTAILASFGTAASASGISESVGAAIADNDSINIIYNGQLLTYTDAIPENINDRIMLPFRSVLESMGATVDYDDATRLVTASKKDTTIKFTLEDDTIYVDKDGQTSEVTLDVPMVIKNDRTLVPIRFISNALGMQVGWEGDYQTVFIVDTDSYIDTLTESIPNLIALSEMDVPQYNSGVADLSFGLAGTSEIDSFAATINLKADSKTVDNTASVNAVLNADFGNIGIPTVTDSSVEIVMADGKLYLKTDLVEQLFADSQDDSLKLVADTLTDEHWFFIDINKLIDEVYGDYMPAEIKELYKSLLSGDYTALENISLPDMIKNLITTEGDATMASAMQADLMVDMYAAIDKYIKITDNGAEIVFNNEFLKEAVMVSGIPEEEVDELLGIMDINVSAITNYTETQADSAITMKFSVKDGDYGIDLTFDITEALKLEENLSPVEIPESAIDLINLAELIK